MPITVLWCQSCDSIQKCSKTCNINQLWQAWNDKISCRNINKELKRARYSCQKFKFTMQSTVDFRKAKLKKQNFKIQSRIQRRLLFGLSLYFLHCRSLFIKSLALPAGGGERGGGGVVVNWKIGKIGKNWSRELPTAITQPRHTHRIFYTFHYPGYQAHTSIYILVQFSIQDSKFIHAQINLSYCICKDNISCILFLYIYMWKCTLQYRLFVNMNSVHGTNSQINGRLTIRYQAEKLAIAIG
jgi:hypothetical protein